MIWKKSNDVLNIKESDDMADAEIPEKQIVENTQKGKHEDG